MKVQFTTALLTAALLLQGLIAAWMLPHLLPSVMDDEVGVEWGEKTLPDCHGGGTIWVAVDAETTTERGTCVDCTDCPYASACHPPLGMVTAVGLTPVNRGAQLRAGVPLTKIEPFRATHLRPPIA